MSGPASTNATTRPVRRRRPAARLAVPALALLLVGAAATGPARTAVAAGTSSTTASAAAGATWSQLMRRKLTLDVDAARLTVLLPTLRATAGAQDSALVRAQRTQRVATKTLADATSAVEHALAAYTTARTAAAAARKAVAAAQKRRPLSRSRVTRAQRALVAANAVVRARAVTAGRTASAAEVAQTAYSTAIKQVAAAAVAVQSATKAVTDTQQKIISMPKLEAALAVQTAAISKDVVIQSRTSFTTAQTAQVYGVTVNKIVAYPFQRMIDDAAKAGVPLSGGGFRTKQRQIELRTANGCPDVWTAPASSCRVPTAIPGRSLHELGLAIDLTSGGRSITDRRSAAFKWLAANAGRYGFVNLPSEPWHWSITGG